jgi:hypothetical protein
MKYWIGLSCCLFFLTACSSTSQEKEYIDKYPKKFGERIGQSHLTKAYSNCDSDLVANETNYVFLKGF